MSSPPSAPPRASTPASLPPYVPSELHSSPSASSSSSLLSSHPHRSQLFFPSHWLHLPHLNTGAGPFVTRLVHQLPSGHHVYWESRRHRKRVTQRMEEPSAATLQTKQAKGELSSQQAASLQRAREARQRLRVPWYRRLFPFHPWRIPWWTAVLFDVGSLCFVFSSIAEFIPTIYDSLHLDTAYVGWTAFTGSVLFTVGSIAGVLEVVKAPLMAKWYPMHREEEKALNDRGKAQLSTDQGVATAQADARPTFSSLLARLDFWVTIIQLIGALAFNINTGAFTGSFTLTSTQTTWLVDFCDVFASCCFTVSGYLSLMEVTHSFLPVSSDPLHDVTSIEWYVTLQNFLGGVGFLLNGILIIYYPDPGQLPPAYPLLIGSLFFQIASHLQYLEQADKWPPGGAKAGVTASSEANSNGKPQSGDVGEDGQDQVNGRMEEGRAEH